MELLKFFGDGYTLFKLAYCTVHVQHRYMYMQDSFQGASVVSEVMKMCTDRVTPPTHGKLRHRGASCHFKEADYCGCGKIGHLLTVCRNKLASKQKAKPKQITKPKQRAKPK